MSRNGFVLAALVLTGACRQDMHDQPRIDPLEKSPFFADGRGARPQVEGTVARGQLHEDTRFYEGREEGELVTSVPVPVTRDVLERGRERFDIFCSPCHGRVGDGQGMIVKRGFRAPPTYHQDRLREAPEGHFFDVISNGFGSMESFDDRIPPRDRWAIVAYIRALQLSQQVSLAELPPAVREEFQRAVE